MNSNNTNRALNSQNTKRGLDSNQIKSYIMNLIVLTIGGLLCVYPAQVCWGLSTTRGWLPLVLLFLIIVFDFLNLFNMKHGATVKMRYMLICHLAYALCVLFCIGDNSLLFVMASISQIIVLLTYDRKLVLYQCIFYEISFVIIRLFLSDYIPNTFIASSYLFGMVGIGFQTFIFMYIIDTYWERIKAENELVYSSKELLRVVERKCEDAKIATKSKSEFLANMSHEIRTPINAVLGLNEMIVREAHEENIQGYACDIRSASTTLLNLINDILDFSKIESGKMELLPVSYDVSSVINDMVNMINIKAVDKGLSFKVSVDASLPRILVGDGIRVKQIIVNILTNAVKYTEKGYVHLKIGYEKIEDFAINLKVSVEDTGIGMEKESIDRLFAPFERIEEKRNRSIEGTGLGMSITQSFLKLMDSRLEVESVYGEGSVFSFSVRQEVDDWDCVGDFSENYKNHKSVAETYVPSLYAPGAHILVVDDMPMNISVFKGLLKMTKIVIDEAGSGSRCIELCREHKYDVIFLDHMMPGMDGIETYEHVINDPDSINKNTPIVILTANAISGARDEYLSHGFDDYMSKPIDPEKLEKTLIRFLPENMLSDLPSDFDVLSDDVGNDGLLERIRTFDFINVDEGIAATGSADNYLSIVSEFLLTSDKRIGILSDYLVNEDYKNYTIQIHGLKTALRVIGVKELSELARNLELAGNDNDINFISENNPIFMEEFLRIASALTDIFPAEESDENLPLIDGKMLDEMIEVMKQGVEDFDFDLIESVVNSMSAYRMPEAFCQSYRKLKLALADVDFDGMSEVLDNYN